MYAVSLALVVLSQIPLSTETNQNDRSGVLTSYDDAYYRAGQEGKPIFILFTNQTHPTELRQLQSQGVLNGYLVVVADWNTESGRKIFAQFNMKAEGVTVIERNRQWQFARYERKLNSDELTRVANACLTAVGYPTVDVLQANFAAYPPLRKFKLVNLLCPANRSSQACRSRAFHSSNRSSNRCRCSAPSAAAAPAVTEADP